MPHIPPDIIQSVLESTYYTKGFTPDYATLRSSSLVCKAWRDYSQKLLFHDVRLHRYHDHPGMVSFRSAVFASTQRGRTLASYIRRTDIIIGVQADVNLTVDDLLGLVSHCHGLYAVTLRVPRIHEFGPSMMEGLRRAHEASLPTPIRSLSLLLCGTQSPILYQLLAVWPSIQYLRVGTELAAPPPIEPNKVQLYELTLFREPPLAHVEWLLSASKNTLRILECVVAPGSEYDHLLEDLGKHLLSLRIFRHTRRFAAVVQFCPELKEIVITQLSSFLPLGDLPPTLEHLSFRSMSAVATIPLQPIISAIGNLPKLRLVSCDASKRNVDFASLSEKCQGKGAILWTGLLPIRLVSAAAE